MNTIKISVSLLRKYGIKPYQTCLRLSSTIKSYDLKNYRSLVSIKGPDAPVFLQNVITDDIYKLNAAADSTTPNSPRSLYAMILNSRGRVMYDVLVHLFDASSSGKEYFLELDSAALQDCVKKLLEPLKLRKRVQITKCDEAEYKLFALVDNSQSNFELATSNKNIVLLEKDPRYSRLGYRAILKTSDSNDKLSSYLDNIVDSNDINSYKEWLYRNGVAENREDIPTTNAIPLEYNLVYLNGVSFDKGCYLGQELVAKTHHTGVIRKRVMPIQINFEKGKETKLSAGTEIKNEKTGKTVGKLINHRNRYGIAMLRLENIDKSNMSLTDAGSNRIYVTTEIPKFWGLDDPNIKALSESFSK